MKKIILTILSVVTLLSAYTAPMEIPGAATVDSRVAFEIQQKGILFLDVRPAWMVAKEGKIKGAVNLHAEKITKESAASVIRTLDTPVVVYCNGEGCSLSEEAIKSLLELGYKHLYFYRDGYPAWTYFRLPTE